LWEVRNLILLDYNNLRYNWYWAEGQKETAGNRDENEETDFERKKTIEVYFTMKTDSSSEPNKDASFILRPDTYVMDLFTDSMSCYGPVPSVILLTRQS
jgi:hypothetical protein